LHNGDTMDYTHLPRKIQNPYWGNNEKTQVICEFNYEGGPVVTAAVSDTNDGNPDWKEIFNIWTSEQLDELTEKALREDHVQSKKIQELKKDDIERMKVDALFSAKLDAFEIDEIKNSKNRAFKSKIRKAKTLLEVTAYASALIMLENAE